MIMGFGDSDSTTGDNSFVFCLFLWGTSLIMCFMYYPGHPNTSWEGIWTPKTYPKHKNAGGIWMSRVRNKAVFSHASQKGTWVPIDSPWWAKFMTKVVCGLGSRRVNRRPLPSGDIFRVVNHVFNSWCFFQMFHMKCQRFGFIARYSLDDVC